MIMKTPAYFVTFDLDVQPKSLLSTKPSKSLSTPSEQDPGESDDSAGGFA